MKFLSYTKMSGFQEIDFEPEWGDEDYSEWALKAGFETYGHLDSSDSEADWGTEVRIYCSSGNKEWCALVEIGDGGTIDWILVRTRIDLLYLRMELIPFHALATIRRFDRLVKLSEQAFCAWHGHEAMYPCQKCDPLQVDLEERERRTARKKREAEKEE
jgi:hypothetical protein